MTETLAIFSPVIGATSETFILRHIQDLHPNFTIAIANSMLVAESGNWNNEIPVLDLSRIPYPRLSQKLINIRYFATKTPPSIREYSVGKFLNRYAASTLLSEYLPASLEWINICKNSGIKLFVHAHGYDVSQGYIRNPEWRRKYLNFETIDGIITINQISKSKLVEIGLNPDKIHIIPCGVDVPNEPSIKMRNENIRCLAVGRMTGKKAPILLLDAFRRAITAFPRLHLDYIGGGELLAAAYQYLNAFALENSVTLHGSQPHEFVLKMLQEADIFLQHSITDPVTGDQEGLPVSILEAMAHSVPVISTKHAGIPEAVISGENGYLVGEGDTRGMAEAIVQLASDFDLRENFGHNGWARAKHYFRWELEKKKLCEVMGLG